MSFLPGFNHDKWTTYKSVRICHMLLDAINLHEFYTSPLGLTTKRVIGKHIREVWPEVKNLNVLGIGYCPPYLNAFHSKAKGVISVMPVSQGILLQSNKVASQSCLTSEAENSPFRSFNGSGAHHTRLGICRIRPTNDARGLACFIRKWTYYCRYS